MYVNKKGFTLIELLAVITIMGILLVVAIPAISRTIENSKKDMLIDIAMQYVNGVRTMWKNDELKCQDPDDTNTADGYDWVLPSQAPAICKKSGGGTKACPYVVLFDTSGAVSDGEGMGMAAPFTPVLETVVKSPWGNSDIQGFVRIWKNGEKVNYGVRLADTKGHGVVPKSINDEYTKIDRSVVFSDLKHCDSGDVSVDNKCIRAVVVPPSFGFVSESKHYKCILNE